MVPGGARNPALVEDGRLSKGGHGEHPVKHRRDAGP